MSELQKLQFPAAPINQPLKLTMSGGHTALKLINNWPEENRSNITMMITAAQQIAKRINGEFNDHYKVNVKMEDKLICFVYKSKIEWQPNTDKYQKQYYPKATVVKQIEEAFNPPTVKESEINDDLLNDAMFTMATFNKLPFE